MNRDDDIRSKEVAIRLAARTLEMARIKYENLEFQNMPTDLEERIAAAEAYALARFRVAEAEAKLEALIRPEQNGTERVQEKRE